jgi:hypothetical protein
VWICQDEAIEEKLFKIELLLSNKQVLGHCTVDLYTLATGPAFHFLPLMNVRLQSAVFLFVCSSFFFFFFF